MKSALLILTFVFALLSSLLASSAFALTGTPDELFKPISKKHVEKLLDRGISNIGKIDLKKLDRELDGVNWRMNVLDGFFTGSGGIRSTGMYIVKDKMVVVNMLALKNLVGQPVPLISWALHEAMGALGYDDEFYNLSSVISIMANEEAEYPIPVDYFKSDSLKYSRSNVDRTYQMSRSSGGSTVIGGGGDAVIIELKQKLLKRYLRWMKEIHPEVTDLKYKEGFEKITQLEIEFDIDDIDYNNYDSKFDGKKLTIGYGGQLDPTTIYQVEYLNKTLTELFK